MVTVPATIQPQTWPLPSSKTLAATGYHGHCTLDYVVGSTICHRFLCELVLSTQEVLTVFSGHWTWEN